ncbi:Flp pilus assembly pilin Flp [Pseudarthrobacter siccitolerans]|uniref:Flp pilus assembly pilin Flp n=1 Tax=Pseudarthrobacter siccitolerans TaxID=861266 RepID=A0ABU0PIA1_9MICC|nr:Flp pilus assembly pilin Flp [Pseudarthrobacter siccitolerans]
MIELLSGLGLRLRQRALRLLPDEVGATATEYGILMAFIVVIAFAGVSLFGLALSGWYDELTAHLKVVLGIP